MDNVLKEISTKREKKLAKYLVLAIVVFSQFMILQQE